MKSIKITILSMVVFCLATNLSVAQQRYLVHQDNVKPSMIGEYTKAAKDFHSACVEHNPNTSWLTVSTSNFQFLYVTPIDNMCDIDKRPLADMAEKMGDKFGEFFENFDECYDSHGSYTLISSEELSYMPDGFAQTQEGQDYRDYFWIYYAPRNAEKVKEGMKAVKEMFKSKGSKNHYRVYRSGFGSMENYYLIAMSSKDKIDSAQKEKANNELLGPERFDTFTKVMKYADRMEEATGNIRRDLSYSHKKD